MTPIPPRDAVRGATNDNVVTLPGRAAEAAQKPAEPVEPAERWKGIAEAGSAVAAGLDAIVARRPELRRQAFRRRRARRLRDDRDWPMRRATAARSRICSSREVYDGFEAAIRERESKGETVETRFVSIDKSDITGAEVRGRTAQVTVRFVSQLVSVTRDKAGNVIDGNPDKVTEVTDVWTFARDLSSRDPNWKLVATEAGQ